MTSRSDFGYAKTASAILAVAVVLRTTWGMLIPVVPFSDGKAYDLLARNLVEYGVYGFSADQLSANWPPGISAVYAALYTAFGYSYAPIVALNIALSTAIVGLTIWLGRIYFDDTVALIAGALMAIWPSEIAYVTILASELPFTLLVLSGVAAWFSARLPMSVRAIVSGLAFGSASYFRPIALLLPIVLWLTAILNWQKLRMRLPMLLIAMIIISATIAPWCVRNSKIFGHIVLLTSSNGVNFWIGNNPDATGFFMTPPARAGLNEYEQNALLEDRAKQYIIAQPLAFVLRTIKRAILLHARETIAATWNAEGIQQRLGEWALFPSKVLMQGFWLAALLLAVIGLTIMARERGIVPTLTHPVVLIWIYFTVVYAVMFVDDRFHFPSHPLISMLAAVAISAIVTHFRGKPIGIQS